jgi:hypothetical protein
MFFGRHHRINSTAISTNDKQLMNWNALPGGGSVGDPEGMGTCIGAFGGRALPLKAVLRHNAVSHRVR